MNDPRMATLAAFYRLFYAERRYDEAAPMLAPGFVNHHPGARGIGPAGMIDDFTRLGPGPAFRVEPVRMVADGDIVWVLARASGAGPGGLAVDLWRFDAEGRLAEHWDAFRRLEPGESAEALFGPLARG